MEKILIGGVLYFARNGDLESASAMIGRNKEKIAINEQDNNKRTFLSYAAENGSINSVRLALSLKADPDICDKTGMTALMYSTKNGNTNCTVELLAKIKNVDVLDKNGWSALMHAAAGGRRMDVMLLLKRGALKELKNNENLNAAAIAHIYGWKELHTFIKNYGKENRRGLEKLEDLKSLLKKI